MKTHPRKPVPAARGGVKEELLNLIIQAKRADPEVGPFSEFLAVFLVANGVVVRSDAQMGEPDPAAAPAKTGQWKEQEFGLFYVCSVCGHLTDVGLSKYCPECGARMDEEGGAANEL